MRIEANFGKGCWHCETGRPIEYIDRIALCLECVMLWFPGRSVEWWEARHTHYADHESET